MNQGNWLMLDLIIRKYLKVRTDRQTNLRWTFVPGFCCINRRIITFGGIIKFPANGIAVNNAEIRKKNIRILPVIRATEMRYIMAECYARKNQFAEAYEILNEIREKRSETAQVGDEWKTMEQLEVARDFEMFQRDLIQCAQREGISGRTVVLAIQTVMVQRFISRRKRSVS